MAHVLSLHPWQLLVLLAALLIAGEIAFGGFVALPLGIACLLTSLAGLFTSNWSVLLGLLALLAIVLFFSLRARQRSTVEIFTGAEGMVGQETVVVEAIPANGEGYVKLYGDRWAARGRFGESLEIGERAVIYRFRGNKVWVDPLHKETE